MQYAAEADDLSVRTGPSGDQSVVHAPTKVIASRGDTLNRPLLTVVFDSPAEGVIRTRVSHHDGEGWGALRAGGQERAGRRHPERRRWHLQ